MCGPSATFTKTEYFSLIAFCLQVVDGAEYDSQQYKSVSLEFPLLSRRPFLSGPALFLSSVRDYYNFLIVFKSLEIIVLFV